MGIPIVVIAGQKQESVKKWLKDHPMPFPFLIDEDRKVIKAFDVYHPFGIDALNIAHPSMFLISADQKVVYAYIGKNQRDRPTNELTERKIHELLSDTFNEE